jgi:hypothetical protein
MKRRKGRPLLLAAAGVAFVSFACEKPDVITSPSPVGNLRGPEPIPLDAGVEEDSGVVAPADAGTTSVPEADIVTAPSPPVGNLRAPDHVVVTPKPDAGAKKKPPGKI